MTSELKFIQNPSYNECLAAVKENGMSLEYVPQQYHTPELCKAAVNQNGYALMYLKFLDGLSSIDIKGLCVLAIKQYGGPIRHITPDMQTRLSHNDMVEICTEAVIKNNDLIEVAHSITPSLTTDEMVDMCLVAISQNKFVADILRKVVNQKRDDTNFRYIKCTDSVKNEEEYIKTSKDILTVIKNKFASVKLVEDVHQVSEDGFYVVQNQDVYKVYEYKYSRWNLLLDQHIMVAKYDVLNFLNV